MQEGDPTSATARSVLVVDDETDLRRLAVRRLERAGFRVREARDGEDGWEQALDVRPDALVLDVRMPRLDGIALTRRLRDHPPTSDVGIVLLTASVEDRDQAAALTAGADAYLNKPCTADALVSAVRQVIDERGRPSDPGSR